MSVTLADIQAAADRLKGHAVETPLLESPALNDRLGARILIKPETLQRVGAFKFRGAYNRLVQLDADQRTRGVVAFSNNGGADTIGSQFYITYGPQLHLNNKFTIFGHVIDGHDVLDSIERVPVGKKNRPVSDVTLDSVTIHANPLAA